MTLSVKVLRPDALHAALSDLAALRISVFQDWPYLYDGDAGYEERYLERFAEAPGAILVTAWDSDQMVGAATGAPLGEHDAAFAEPIAAAGFDPARVFYCAESVLLKPYRGQGMGHRFFDLREAHARALGFELSAFCTVIRQSDHPARPQSYRALDSFWRERGYAALDGAIAKYDWRDVGAPRETTKRMQVWIRSL